MEDSLLLEVEKLTQTLGQNCGQPKVDLTSALGISIINALWFVLTSERLALDDPKLQKLVTLVNRLFSYAY